MKKVMFQLRKGYFGANSTGVNISSSNGDCLGINIMLKSDIDIEKCQIKDIKVENRKGENYYHKLVKYKHLRMPNRIPIVIGIRIERDCLVDLYKVCITNLKSPNKPIMILKEEN